MKRCTLLARFPREHHAWRMMRYRCLNPSCPNWGNYGGRGITICDRWLVSFENFITDMGPRPSSKHSIDRIDNGGNYEPSNCRWATVAEQNANRRQGRPSTGRPPVLFVGDRPLAAVARELGVSYPNARNRLRAGRGVLDSKKSIVAERRARLVQLMATSAGLRIEDIATAMGASAATVRADLSAIKRAGLVVWRHRCRYSIRPSASPEVQGRSQP
jgi:hypothetical protein